MHVRAAEAPISPGGLPAPVARSPQRCSLKFLARVAPLSWAGLLRGWWSLTTHQLEEALFGGDDAEELANRPTYCPSATWLPV